MGFSRGRLDAIGLIVLFLFGLVFLRGPTPHIAIKPETLTSLGPFDLTNTVLTSWIVVALIVVTVFFATRRWELTPRGAQNFVEWFFLEGEFIVSIIRVPFVNYEVTESLAGERNARRFFPLVITVFLFVLISNWLSLLPVFNVIGLVKEEEHGFVMDRTEVGSLDVGVVSLSGLSDLRLTGGGTIDEDDPVAEEQYREAKEDGKLVGELIPVFRGANTDLNTPLALAIVSFLAVAFWGISSLGLGTYLRQYFNLSGIVGGLIRFNFGEIGRGIIDAFVGFLEFVSVLVRLLSFTARLFGNLFAGEVVILMFVFLTPLVMTLPFYGLELFVGFIQAYIFAILTLVFAIMTVGHGEHAAHEGEEGHAPTAQSLRESEA
jgi:F-type H+-transporting ATPase subunit a